MCRQTEYYHKMRILLFKVLGRKCVKCGSTIDLEFDVIIPDPEPKSHHGRMSSCQRASYYVNQCLADNLQVLCSPCNSRKHNHVENNETTEDEASAVHT